MKKKLIFFLGLQDESPIYNIAAGTCLRAREPSKAAVIELALCSNNLFSTWDLIDGEL